MRWRIPTQTLLLELRRVARVVERPPSPGEFAEHGAFAPKTVTDRFASWQAARWAAGLTREVDRAERTQTPESELLDAIRRLADELGKVPSRSDMLESGEYSATTYQNRFGSWEAARTKAGYPAPNRDEFKRETLLQDLRDFAEELGHTPRKKEMKYGGPHSSQTYYNRFGAWTTAVEAAGLTPHYDTDTEETVLTGRYTAGWEAQREKALERDEYTCTRCGVTQEEHIDQTGQALHVHHKTPVREFDDVEAAHRLDNLRTLCRFCHGEIEP